MADAIKPDFQRRDQGLDSGWKADCAASGNSAAQNGRADRDSEQFRKGYQQAVADLAAGMVWIAEEFIRDDRHDRNGDIRKSIYRFVEHLERKMERLPDVGYLEDGLGI